MTDALRKRLLSDVDKFLAYNAVLAEFSAADKAADDAWRTLKSRAEYVNGALLDYDWTGLLK
jgi:hypothetical protein